MDEIHPPLATEQSSQDYGYGLAYRLARERVAGIGDIGQLCLRTGARAEVVDSRNVVLLEYLGDSYQVNFPDVDISMVGSRQEVPLRDRILILHYLGIAKGTPLTGKPIAYKELPEGTGYFRTFYLRAIKPLVGNFGGEPKRLLEVSQRLGAKKAEQGDVSVTIPAFPRVPLTLVLWRGDDEFPAQGNILFDSSIPDYLATEDINVLCEIIAWKLVKSLRETQP